MPKVASEWQFAQSFGTEESEEHGFCEEDIFTALDFDAKGNLIALGDRAGRITVFETVEREQPEAGSKLRKPRKRQFFPIEYKFYTEFQSHERGFDRLHSVEIEESINMIRWLNRPSRGHFLLSTNDTCVKLWRLGEQRVLRWGKRVNGNNSTAIRVPGPSKHPKHATTAVCKREFKNAHGTCHIDSISVNVDGETFISTDALKINLWNLEHSEETFNAVNIKPDNLADLTEVITSAQFHPQHCHLMQYSTSLGAINLCDTRQSALVTGASKVFQGKKGDGFFSEVIESISGSVFSPDGSMIIARDYLTLKVWDVRSERKPVQVFPIHDYLEEYLSELHQNECIFDKFECATNPTGDVFVSGSYDSNFVIGSMATGQAETIHATSDSARKTHKRVFSFNRKKDKRARVAQMDFAKKTLRVACHPRLNAVAVASLNKVYIYQAVQ